MQHVEVKRAIAAPRQAVWDLYTDHVSWERWSRIGKVRLERQGTPPPNGVGCVRVISKGGVSVYEEVLSFEPPRAMTYRVVRGGIPIRDHFGEVLFADHGEETLITWRCRFNSRIPGLGFAFRKLVERIFSDTLASLADHRFGPR